MNKEVFLEELRGCLQVLEDQEQEDILAEYAQHIDMKLQKGLSEEEAIQDFGPMKELAAKILEAYHVKPEFRQKKTAVGFPGWKGSKARDGRQFFGRMGCYLKGKVKAAFYSMGMGLRWMGRKCGVFWGWLAKPFRRRKTEVAIAETGGSGECLQEGSGMGVGQIATGQGQEEAWEVWDAGHGTAGQKPEKAGRHVGIFFRMAGRGIAALWRLFLAFCAWWLRLLWNAWWLICSLFCAIMGLVALASFGALLVLLPQGYPLRGAFLISLGGILCFGALSCGAFSLLVRKGKEGKGMVQDGETGQPGGEVQYE